MRGKRLVGIVIALFGHVALRPLTDGDDATDMRAHVVKWIPAVVMTAYTYIVEGEDAESLGLGWDGPKAFVKRVVAGMVVMLGANVVLEPLHERLGAEQMQSEMAEFTEASVLERLFIALTAGVTEELLFRGYALERIESETGSRLVAAASSTAAFVLAHKSDTWSWGSLVLIAQPATLITTIYLRSRDLLAAMTVHALNDAVGLLLLERVLDEDD
jgi:membrane protease YdiL (CAAX protease family)